MLKRENVTRNTEVWIPNAIMEKDKNNGKCSCNFYHRNKNTKRKYVIDL